jgi:superfamily I DNA/RNA helicase
MAVLIPSIGSVTFDSGGERIGGVEELPPQEAKLLYVAMTRATMELVVTGAG